MGQGNPHIKGQGPSKGPSAQERAQGLRRGRAGASAEAREGQDLTRPRPADSPCLALPCLAYLASDRPRLPCLHLATTARPPSAAGRRGAPLLLLLVQARRARPMRGEVSQARPGLVHTTHVLLGLSRLETFSEICTLKKKRKTILLDVLLRGIRYRDLLRLVIWSRMHRFSRDSEP